MRAFLQPVRWLSVVIAVSVMTACDRVPLPDTSPDITAEDIYAHVAYLASDELGGRPAASEFEIKAAHYIEAIFKKNGLKPAGKDGDFLFPFEIVAGVKAGPENGLSVTIEKSEKEYFLNKDFIPLSFTDNGTFEGELVFVGYGIESEDLNYNDYENVDVKDKIVLALRFSPDGNNPHGAFYSYASLRRKATAARENGARGIIFVTGPRQSDEDDLVPLRYDRTPLRSGIGAISLRREIAEAIFAAEGKSLADIQQQIDEEKAPQSFALRKAYVRFTTDVQEVRRAAHNVAGLLEGSDPNLRNEIIVVGAHFDHLGLGENNSLAPEAKGQIHNGADDNASGTAGMLELVEALSRADEKPRRSLLFIAFSAEERGLLGSRAYVDDPNFPADRVVAMINMDMIGRMKDNKLIVHGLGTSPVWQAMLDSLNRDEPFRFQLKLNQEGVGPSDHSSFYQKNIPVLFFFTGLHEDYHKPSDDYDKINTTDEARIVQFVQRVIRSIDALPARPQFTKVEEPERRQMRGGFRVYLGTIPDYAETDIEGMKLSGVRKGGPAEKAGLKAGDIIIKFGDREIKNVYDYTYALQDARPGQEVDIVVLRNGQKVTIRMTLEGRK